jgi:hypothetical protein
MAKPHSNEEKVRSLGTILRRGIERTYPLTEVELKKIQEMALLRRQHEARQPERRQDLGPEIEQYAFLSSSRDVQVADIRKKSQFFKW